MSPNQIAAVVFIALGIGYGYLTSQLPTRTISGEPSSAFFPWILASCLLLLSVILLIQDIREKTIPRRVVFSASRPAIRTAIGLFVVLVYLLLLPYAGFLIPSILFFGAIMWIGGERSYLRLFGYSVVIPIFLYFIFKEAFQIPLSKWGSLMGVF
ncbi:MAG: tripartite tricarboxylate transporter TctB family protein [Smithellaceae bacterium]|nr:tripartite tricarboxylate transporter TctB family protein [Smithellaceae bacterium]